MNAEIRTKLEARAMKATIPFCDTCCKNCPTGRCAHCGSDDLMKYMPGVGIQHGLEWAFEHLVDDIESVDTEEVFERMIKSFYNKTSHIGPLEVDTLATLKEYSSWWHIAKKHYILELVSEGQLTKIGGKHYWTDNLRNRL